MKKIFILVYLVLLTFVLFHRSQCTKELIDIQEDLALSPLSLIPHRTCNSSLSTLNGLHCCTRECYINPYVATKLPVLDEYAIDCHHDLDSLTPCSPLTIDLDLNAIRRKLKYEKRREREMKEKLNALNNRLSPIEVKKRFFKWKTRLVASWILHKIFTKGFELAQPLITSMLSQAAG